MNAPNPRARPIRVIRLPLVCCPECHIALDFGEWEALPLVKHPPRGDERREWRRCWCGFTLGVDTEGLKALDVHVPEDWYRQLFPNTARRTITVGKPRAVAAALRWLANRLGG